MTDGLIEYAKERAAILHASSAWGSADGLLIDALVRRIEELEAKP